MKIVKVVLKVLLSLILIMPILGTLGVFPEPTRDLYNTDLAFEFITLITEVKYITIMISVVHVLAIIALWTRREALAALLIAPITANIVGFHLMIDGGLLTPGSLMVHVLVLLNAYFMWKYRDKYQPLLRPRS